MATKGKDKILKGQITFAFFEEEKVKVNLKKENKKEEKKLKPIKMKHFKVRKIK